MALDDNSSKKKKYNIPKLCYFNWLRFSGNSTLSYLLVNQVRSGAIQVVLEQYIDFADLRKLIYKKCEVLI
jgi:hypothetical protein